MSLKQKTKSILKLVARDITIFFPYFLLLYIFIYFMSFFFSIWLSFWQETALHVSLVIFALVYVWVKIRPFYTGTFRLDFYTRGEELSYLIKDFLWYVYKIVLRLIYGAIYFIKKAGIFLWQTVRRVLTGLKKGYFVPWVGGVALLFLSACPFLLMFKKDAIAEKSAVYAYYFLVLAVVLMLIDNFFTKNTDETPK